jgi:UDP-glucose 4-epimerase
MISGMVMLLKKTSRKGVPHQVVDRRPGDIATCYSDSTYIAEKLDWMGCGLDEMYEDTCRSQSMNPGGHSGQ